MSSSVLCHPFLTHYFPKSIHRGKFLPACTHPGVKVRAFVCGCVFGKPWSRKWMIHHTVSWKTLIHNWIAWNYLFFLNATWLFSFLTAPFIHSSPCSSRLSGSFIRIWRRSVCDRTTRQLRLVFWAHTSRQLKHHGCPIPLTPTFTRTSSSLLDHWTRGDKLDLLKTVTSLPIMLCSQRSGVTVSLKFWSCIFVLDTELWESKQRAVSVSVNLGNKKPKNSHGWREICKSVFLFSFLAWRLRCV